MSLSTDRKAERIVPPVVVLLTLTVSADVDLLR